MKKVIIILILILLSLIILSALFIISIPIVNDLTAKSLEIKLLNTALPPQTEVLQSLSHAEKMSGAGNGMQYIGVLLIESELSLEELTNHYTSQNPKIKIKPQKSEEITITDMPAFSFDEKTEFSDKTYVVYLWGKGIPPFDALDIRGH